MLMTNDGDLALRVTHPRYGIEKVYNVLIRGSISKAQISGLTNGIELEDGIARAKRARVIDSSKGQTLVEMTLTEGRFVGCSMPWVSTSFDLFARRLRA